MRLKTVHISNRTKFSWNRVPERWRCYLKALSPNVFDRTAGIESKILPEDLRLYKDDLNVSKSHKIFRSKAANYLEGNKQYLKLCPGFNRKPMQTTKKG